MPFFCYIVRCADGSYYTGWSTDPQRRVSQHNKGQGSKYTRMHRPVTLVYVEEQATRSEAMQREYRIKRLGREKKHALVDGIKGKK